ncbi:hypothetical protein [Cesiribacter sp. SM1]|uniref:hypothetical protein n=1 Tax=Cesiribacter sp. SM1 TaxID=2861196 RepID=UPI001CD2F25B|nr:hypothetical protein [Cesiribacter sp. SM1]
MKTVNLFLVAVLSFSVIFTSCEKEEVEPVRTETPEPGTTDDEDNANNGGGTTTPPNNGGGTPGNGGSVPPWVNSPAADARLTSVGMTAWGYDAQKRLNFYDSYNANDDYRVIYEGNQAVRMEFATGHYLVYEWEGGKVTAARTYAQDGLEINWFRFEYSGDKLVKKIKSSWYPNYIRGWLTVSEYNYDEKGNLSQATIRHAQSDKFEDLGQPSIITWGDYDDKINPRPAAESDLYLPGVTMFVNNPGFRNAGSKELFSYTYHESGLPYQRFDKVEGYEHVPAITNTYEYQ